MCDGAPAGTVGADAAIGAGMATSGGGIQAPAGVDWIVVTGGLDVGAAGGLELELAALTERVVVVDLRGVVFIDAAGVTALLRAQRAAAAEGREVLLLAGPRVQRVLGIVGLGRPAGWPDDEAPSGPARRRAVREHARSATAGVEEAPLLTLGADVAPTRRRRRRGQSTDGAAH